MAIPVSISKEVVPIANCYFVIVLDLADSDNDREAVTLLKYSVVVTTMTYKSYGSKYYVPIAIRPIDTTKAVGQSLGSGQESPSEILHHVTRSDRLARHYAPLIQLRIPYRSEDEGTVY